VAVGQGVEAAGINDRSHARNRSRAATKKEPGQSPGLLIIYPLKTDCDQPSIGEIFGGAESSLIGGGGIVPSSTSTGGGWNANSIG